MASDTNTLSPDDLALLDRLAQRVVELHMEVPAILTLETSKPLSLLASQTLVFFEPIVQSLFRLEGYRRFAALAERRDALETLTRKIEEQADRVSAERRRAADARRAERAARRS